MIPAVRGLQLGMTRDELVELRGDGIVDDEVDQTKFPAIFFEVAESENQQRGIVYLVSGEPPALQTVYYGDTYPPEVLDAAIERKLRAAAETWGKPLSMSAQWQNPSAEYFMAVWKIAPETLMAISYVPRAARGDKRRNFVLTMFVRSEEGLPDAIEPESFDLTAERASLEDRLRGWGVR